METLQVTELGRGLSENLARWRVPRAVHEPGKIVADLAVALALGGDCLADIAGLGPWPARRPLAETAAWRSSTWTPRS